MRPRFAYEWRRKLAAGNPFVTKVQAQPKIPLIGSIDDLARARAPGSNRHAPALALESRFDLAYNAAHALSLAALRWWGYRSDNRYIAFQALPHTLGLGPGVWRVLATCHQRRNPFEYEGCLEVDERLLTDLLNAAEAVYEAMLGLGPVGEETCP